MGERQAKQAWSEQAADLPGLLRTVTTESEGCFQQCLGGRPEGSRKANGTAWTSLLGLRSWACPTLSRAPEIRSTRRREAPVTTGRAGLKGPGRSIARRRTPGGPPSPRTSAALRPMSANRCQVWVGCWKTAGSVLAKRSHASGEAASKASAEPPLERDHRRAEVATGCTLPSATADRTGWPLIVSGRELALTQGDRRCTLCKVPEVPEMVAFARSLW